MAVGTATLATKWMTTRFLRSNSWQNVSDRWRHTSKHCAPSNILWAAFTVATPLQVISHTVYHQEL
jgi:hypothetical protein